MEDVNYTPEDEMDEDVEDDDEDAEMDFGEETGSDDTSNTDEEEEILDADVRESQEGWQDEDEEYEEDDLVEQEDDDDDDDDDGEDEGAPGPDVEAEMIWQVNEPYAICLDLLCLIMFLERRGRPRWA